MELNGKFTNAIIHTSEVVYVDPCLEKVTQDGVKASQEKCSLD